MTSRLEFHASSVTVEADDDVQSCGFEDDGGRAFGVLNEEDPTQFRVAWRDGNEGEDEAGMSFLRVELTPEKLSIDFDLEGAHYSGPYEGVDVTYDDQDDRFDDLAALFATLMRELPDRLHVRGRTAARAGATAPEDAACALLDAMIDRGLVAIAKRNAPAIIETLADALEAEPPEARAKQVIDALERSDFVEEIFGDDEDIARLVAEIDTRD